MQKISLSALARQQVDRAAVAGGGHTADTVYGGHEKVLRQTVIGMTQGARLAEHDNPGEATVQVLHGRVRMIVGTLLWEAGTGDLLIVPEARHSLEALEDSAVLLTDSPTPIRGTELPASGDTVSMCLAPRLFYPLRLPFRWNFTRLGLRKTRRNAMDQVLRLPPTI